MQSTILNVGDLVVPRENGLLGVGLVTDVKLIRIGEKGKQSIMETTDILWSDGAESLSHRTWCSTSLIVVQSFSK